MAKTWVAAVAAAFRVSLVIAKGGPDERTIRQRVAGRRSGICWHWVRIGDGHAASVWEARQFEAEPGQTIYPVRVAYTVPAGSDPAAPARHYVSTYYAFRSRARRGAWNLISNAQKDDVFGALRAA